MTKKEFLESYAECVQRIRLKEQQSEGDLLPGRISEEIAELEQKRKAVLAAIETAPEPGMRIVLEARYINSLTLEETCLHTCYAKSSVCRLIQEAMRKMHFPAGVT